MTVPFLLITMLSGLLLAAAIFDLATFTIPNLLSGGMFLLFVCFLLSMAFSRHGLSWSEIWPHLTAGGIALAAGMALFASGWIGGGDAKLFAMACLWLGLDAMLDYTIIASLLGGVLTVALLMLRRLPLPALLVRQPWLARLADRQSGVPYGIALAVAALLLLPATDVFKLAAMA